jgi:hypothetical protein
MIFVSGESKKETHFSVPLTIYIAGLEVCAHYCKELPIYKFSETKTAILEVSGSDLTELVGSWVSVHVVIDELIRPGFIRSVETCGPAFDLSGNPVLCSIVTLEFTRSRVIYA